MAPLTLVLALALPAGLAAGVAAADARIALTRLLPLFIAVAIVALWQGHRRSLDGARLAGAALLALAGGVLLGSQTVIDALHPPLRGTLDARFGGFAIGAIAGPRLDAPLLVEGRLRYDASPSPSGASMRLAVERVWFGPEPEATSGTISVLVAGELVGDARGEWTAGRRVRAPMTLRRPATYLNHGVRSEEHALARRGIALVGSVKSAALVEVTARGPWWHEGAAAVRARTRAALGRWVAPRDETAAAVATAILIGDRAGLGHEVERRLQDAGTYHVIAISGGNIAIFAALVVFTLSWTGVRPRLTAAVVIPVLAAYLVVTGGGPSVARATLMATIYFGVRLLDHRTAPGNALALTVVILLLADPLAIADVGLWLSAGATAAILAGAAHAPGHGHAWLRAAGALLLATVCSELALLPVSASVFQRVTLAGLLVNFAAIPAMTAVQIGAMAVVAADAMRLAAVADLASLIVTLAARVLIDSARLVDVAPWLAWRVPAPSLLVVALYYGALVAAWRLLSRPGPAPHFTWIGDRGRSLIRPSCGKSTTLEQYSAVGAPTHGNPGVGRGRLVAGRVSAVVAAAALVWIAAAPAWLVRDRGDGRLHLTAFDVGQGDGLLVTLPNGRRLLVDAGPRSPTGAYDVGERVLGPALRARGVLGLDYLAVTHAHPDHIGGARVLVRDFAPREVWEGVNVPADEPTLELRAAALRARAAWRTLQRGDGLEIGGVELRVHHPPLPDWERQKVRNDDSLVVELRYGRVSMLLTGDIERDVERELAATLDLLPLVVLKAPHHGSGTSSTAAFLAAVRPAVVVISAGRGNLFGHPVPAVLQRYRDVGAQIFRTDQDGQIDVSTDGQSVEVTTFTGRRARFGGE